MCFIYPGFTFWALWQDVAGGRLFGVTARAVFESLLTHTSARGSERTRFLWCVCSARCASIITTACSVSWEHINAHEWRSTCASRRGRARVCVCVCVYVFECTGCVPDLWAPLLLSSMKAKVHWLIVLLPALGDIHLDSMRSSWKLQSVLSGARNKTLHFYLGVQSSFVEHFYFAFEQ